MYYEFFGLTQAPFRITPNTDFFFGGGNRGPILEALIYAVTHGEGIIKVSGEVGSGKTMLCNMLMERLPDSVETVFIANPNVSPDEILHAIAFDLQLDVAADAPRLEVMHTLQTYLLQRHAEGKRVVMFVEESQGMPLATLEEIRLLSNLETRNDKLLQIVLFGQPELDDNLRQPNIRQLRERITHGFKLGPLNAADIREYLMFRMRAAGYHGPDLFSAKVVNLIERASAGLTRRVNLIADKALLAAFSENTHTIKPQHVEAALRDSEFHQDRPAARTTRRWGWITAAMACVGATAVGVAWWIQQQTPAVAPKAQPAAPVAAPAPAATEPAVSSVPVAPAADPLPSAATPVTPPPAADSPPAAAPEAAAKPPELVAPAATAAVAEPTPKKVSTDVLAERLAASAQFISPKNNAVWTLQVLSTDSEQNLRDHLRFLKKTIEINNIYVYRNNGDGENKPLLSMFYGRYDNQAAAEKMLAELPAQLKSNRPWPRTVQSIRDGMK
jgi:MSHA biogenesis protein MshM